jgi:transcriptional regulator with XRE-family HTH domain
VHAKTLRRQEDKEQRETRRRLLRAEMVRLGITGAQIARQLGTGRSWVSMVLAGKHHSAKVEEALIRAGVPAELFGDSPSPQPSPTRGEGEIRSAGGDACATRK